MTWLLDVSFLVALGWSSHPEHTQTREAWRRMESFATCTAAQMGFLRVCLSPAFKATFADSLAVLAGILSEPNHRFLPDETTAGELPHVTNRQDVTDAHLVLLARKNTIKLATLDRGLCRKPWAADIAEVPFAMS